MSKPTIKEIEEYISHCNFDKSITVSKITAYVIKKEFENSTLRSIPVYEHQLLNKTKVIITDIVATVPSDERYGIFFKMPVDGTTFKEFKSGVYDVEYKLYKNEEKEEISDIIILDLDTLNDKIKECYIDFFCEQADDLPSEDIDDIADSLIISYENYDYEEYYEDEEKD